MNTTHRLVAVLLAGLLVLGAGACDRTQEETGVPGEGIDAPEGAEPEGGVGPTPAEEEGPASDEDPIEGEDG